MASAAQMLSLKFAVSASLMLSMSAYCVRVPARMRP